ncbi:hypothetical protein G6L30_17255 [Agrobacterium rhizogenes]|nr:hypothetical protein [Rhizobium rhizogenes]
MLNIGIRKVGGIWFWNVGRIGGSLFVQSAPAFNAKLERQVEMTAMRALVGALAA